MDERQAREDSCGLQLGNILGLKSHRSSKVCSKAFCTGALPDSTDDPGSSHESSFSRSSGSRVIHRSSFNAGNKSKSFDQDEFDSQYFSGELDMRGVGDFGCFSQSLCHKRNKGSMSDSQSHRRSKSAGKVHEPVQFNEYFLPQDLPPTLLRWMDSLSYEEYAFTNFAPQYTGKWGGISASPAPFESLPYFTPQAPDTPILRSVNNNLQKKKRLIKTAVALFRHLMQYMGDMPSKLPAIQHASEIIKAGILEPPLRDEIYCQILKQIHGNPSSRSVKKGWKMLSICAATFPPSPQLRRLLESVFHENLYDADPFCLARMQKVSQQGARTHVPSPREIHSIERTGTVDVHILAPGQYRLILSLDPTTTVSELCVEVASRFCLPNHSLYGIFKPNSGKGEVSLNPETYLFDHVEDDAVVDAKKVHRTEDSDPIWRTLFERGKHSVVPVKSFSLDPLSSPMEMQTWNRHTQSMSDMSGEVSNSPSIFIFKRKVFTSERMEDETSLDFEYHQAVYDCLSGIYALSSEDAVLTMAYILHADYAAKEPTLSTETVDRIRREYRIPEAWLSDFSREEFFNQVFEALHAIVPDAGPDTRKRQKLLLNHLKKHCEFYGFSWFWVEQNRSGKAPDQVTLTIGLPGVWLLERTTNHALLKFKYTEIYSWAYSLSAFQIVINDGEKQEKYSFITDRGHEIASVIQSHVNCIVKSRKEDATSPGRGKTKS